MNNYSLWAQIQRLKGDGYRVTIRCVPLRSGVLLQPGDFVSEDCASYAEAKARCDALVQEMTIQVEERGDKILSVDSTISPE